ncbi:DUF6968 family protein [Alsobacter soli]|nr:hypothetical protein [Alsobacter soli]
MIILTHRLRLQSPQGERAIEIAIHQPEPDDRCWTCAYSIGWPDRTRKSQAYGLDALQALVMALQKIGSEIYTSDHHRSGSLRAEGDERGYGFPVPQGLKDMVIGSDADLV